MNERDQTYLEDMLLYGRDAISFLGDTDEAALAGDKKTRYALVRAVEIVGEAASKVSADGRAEQPGIDWRRIVGMRNNLVHGYRGIDLSLLVEVVRNRLPPLVEHLQSLLGDIEE